MNSVNDLVTQFAMLGHRAIESQGKLWIDAEQAMRIFKQVVEIANRNGDEKNGNS